jgi:hypothetical protein
MRRDTAAILRGEGDFLLDGLGSVAWAKGGGAEEEGQGDCDAASVEDIVVVAVWIASWEL